MIYLIRSIFRLKKFPKYMSIDRSELSNKYKNLGFIKNKANYNKKIFRKLFWIKILICLVLYYYQ